MSRMFCCSGRASRVRWITRCARRRSAYPLRASPRILSLCLRTLLAEYRLGRLGALLPYAGVLPMFPNRADSVTVLPTITWSTHHLPLPALPELHSYENISPSVLSTCATYRAGADSAWHSNGSIGNNRSGPDNRAASVPRHHSALIQPHNDWQGRCTPCFADKCEALSRENILDSDIRVEHNAGIFDTGWLKTLKICTDIVQEDITLSTSGMTSTTIATK